MKAIIKKVTVNKKDYPLKDIDFNAICELEDLGVDIKTVQARSMSLVRALLAYHGSMSAEDAGKEIMAHLQDGGKFEDFVPIIDHFAKCDFFRLFSQNTKSEIAKSENKTKE